MGNKIVNILLALALCFLTQTIVAEESDDQSQFIFKYSEDKRPLFIQKISWPSSQYASKYHFVLKDEKDKILIEKESSVNYLEFSLYSGNYFYNVITYNVLDQAEQETGWQPLTIEKAYLPVINSISIETLYIENYYGDPIVITGKDFTDKVDVKLKDLSNPSRQLIKGVIKESGKDKIVVQFKTDDFTLGNYELLVTNPGNIYAAKPFVVKYKKPVDFLITGGYNPLVNSYMGNFNEALVNVFYPVGFIIDFVIFPFKLKYGFIGFGLSSDFNYLHDKKVVDLYTLLFKNSISFDYLYQFNKYVGILPKIGVGFAFTALIFDYGNKALNKNFMSFDPFITTGFALQIRPYRKFSILTGFDYSQIIYKDSTFGFFKPYISFGYQF